MGNRVRNGPRQVSAADQSDQHDEDGGAERDRPKPAGVPLSTLFRNAQLQASPGLAAVHNRCGDLDKAPATHDLQASIHFARSGGYIAERSYWCAALGGNLGIGKV